MKKTYVQIDYIKAPPKKGKWALVFASSPYMKTKKIKDKTKDKTKDSFWDRKIDMEFMNPTFLIDKKRPIVYK